MIIYNVLVQFQSKGALCSVGIQVAASSAWKAEQVARATCADVTIRGTRITWTMAADGVRRPWGQPKGT